jgi:hypothetical protein
VNRRGSGYDYIAVATQVMSLADPTIHAKQADERALLDALKLLDKSSMGALPPQVITQAFNNGLATNIVRGSSSGGNLVVTPEFVSFALKYAEQRDGLSDLSVFAKVVSGVDRRAKELFLHDKRQHSAQVAHEVCIVYTICMCINTLVHITF